MDKPLLEVEDLSVTFKGAHRSVQAVRGISFSVGRVTDTGDGGETGVDPANGTGNQGNATGQSASRRGRR